MTNGASLAVNFYVQDATGNSVVIGSTNIVYDPARFTNQTHFVDVEMKVPTVKAGDSWAGHGIGVQLLSTVDPALARGLLGHRQCPTHRDPGRSEWLL